MRVTLAQIASWLGVFEPAASVNVTGVSIDSRTLNAGDVFIALKGPNFDGHRFIEVAKEKGASAIIASEPIEIDLPVLTVADTYAALGRLAAHYRQQFVLPVVAVTGSCGKTTTKGLIANILQQAYQQVLSTQGSLNNHVGTPLTLLRLRDHHRAAVIELGANHFGEIAQMAAWVKPNVGLITNAGPCHLEGFGDVAGVARGKGELWAELSSDGTAVLNADDAYFEVWREMTQHCRVVSFGHSAVATIRAQAVTVSAEGHPEFELLVPGESPQPVKLQLLGLCNVDNALAAAAVGYALGVPIQAIVEGLNMTQPVDSRLNIQSGLQGCRVIDDVYNANPASFRAALEVLNECEGRRVVVMGDMGELGENAESYHREIGAHAKALGIDALYACGELSRVAAEAFGEGGQYFASKRELLVALNAQLSAQTTILVKGSRTAHMEQVVSELVEDY